MVLWTAAILMTLIVAAMIALPLVRPTRRGIDRAEYDLVIFRDQLGEVDRDLARGVLSPEQADAARTEKGWGWGWRNSEVRKRSPR